MPRPGNARQDRRGTRCLHRHRAPAGAGIHGRPRTVAPIRQRWAPSAWRSAGPGMPVRLRGQDRPGGLHTSGPLRRRPVAMRYQCLRWKAMLLLQKRGQYGTVASPYGPNDHPGFLQGKACLRCQHPISRQHPINHSPTELGSVQNPLTPHVVSWNTAKPC